MAEQAEALADFVLLHTSRKNPEFESLRCTHQVGREATFVVVDSFDHELQRPYLQWLGRLGPLPSEDQ